MGAGWTHAPRGPLGGDPDLPGAGQREARLTAADQLEIDLRQELRVQQGAMLVPRRGVDAETLAQRVEIGRRTRELAPCERHRVERPLGGKRRAVERRQLRVEELEVETRAVDHQFAVGEELEEGLDDIAERRHIGEEGIGEAVDLEGLLRHLALGVDIGLVDPAGRQVVQ